MNNIKKLILLTAITSLVACGGADERKSVYLDKAMQSMQAGDYDKARIELKNVLQIDPKDARAYFALGEVFEAKQDFRKAFGNYNKAAELEPENPEYLAKIGRFYLVLANNIEKAEEQLGKIEAVDKSSHHGRLLKAGILLKKGDIDAAQSIVEKLNAEDNADKEVALFLAVIYAKKEMPSRAVEVLEKAVAKNKENSGLKAKLASAYILDGKRGRAESMLKEILQNEPDVFNHYLNLARFYQQENRLADAEDVLERSIRNDEDDLKRKQALIGFVKNKKGAEQAISVIDKYIAEGHNVSKLLLMKAALLTEDKDTDSAVNIYKNIIRDYSEEEDGISARVALANIYAGRQELEQAGSILKDAIEIAPNDARVNMANAKLSLLNKDFERAIISLRTVIKENPENLEAYILLAESHKAAGDEQQANDVYQRAYENTRGNLESMKKLARYFISKRNLDMTRKVVDDALRVAPDDYDMMSAKAALLNGAREFDEAGALANRMIKLYPDKPDGYRQVAPSLVNNKQYDEAEALLSEGYKKTNNAELARMHARLKLARGDAAGAVALLEPLVKTAPDENLVLQLAQSHVGAGQADKAAELLRGAVDAHPDWERVTMSLSSLEGKKGSDNALAVLERGIQNNPDSVQMRIAAASIYEQSKDYNAAKKLYEEILSIQQDNLIATNNLAALLADTGKSDADFQRALELADRLKAVDKPVLNDTVGWVYYRNAKYNDAVAILKEVVANESGNPVYNYHLGMAYYQLGDSLNAKKHLEMAANSEKDFNGKDEAINILKKL